MKNIHHAGIIGFRVSICGNKDGAKFGWGGTWVSDFF